MNRNWRTAIDFFEQVYDIEYDRFSGEINGPVSMEDGDPILRSNAPKKGGMKVSLQS